MEILLGSRRVGKTTILRQLISELLAAGVAPQGVCFLALDHPALSGTPISSHLKAFRSLFDHPLERRLHLFLDEVQDSPGWDAELKALYDTERLKLYCTGSTSALLTRQGGKLTGRQITTTIFPLSFPEFIAFRGSRPKMAEDYRYERLVQDYLVTGGYPEEVLSPSPAYLPNLLEDIPARDLMRLFPVKKPALLKDLVRLVVASRRPGAPWLSPARPRQASRSMTWSSRPCRSGGFCWMRGAIWGRRRNAPRISPSHP